ncbi:acyltransferase family protein [Metabacillus litoralis]|uniref:Acyltransferase family protein n=1 Tax=Metabacillus litoralis TaxID=152268 RepID=A0A5C6W567_9BACI|nr:acyltransferase family protein [Metabacillus litoralis]TXC91548.1 acyltransferase family protein [Metabacillus litoralis]
MMESRMNYFDNAKFLLIFLVVFGHVIQPFIGNNVHIMNLYKFIYTFHMPAFILISGYFAKGFKRKGYLITISKKLILPYLIFQVIYSLYYVLIEKSATMTMNPLEPNWSLWFLISLFFWNLTLYFFTKFRPIYVIISAFTLGIIVGYEDAINNFLSLSRTFVFLPLFLIGFYLKLEHFKAITKPQIRIFALILLTLIFNLYYHVNFNYEWLFGSKSYSHFETTSLLSALSRVIFYSASLVTTICFLSLVPRKRAFFTKWGTRTLYVYLLHGFIIQFMRYSEIVKWLEPYQSVILFTILSFLITIILSTKVVIEITKPLIDLNFSHFPYVLRRSSLER